MVQPTWMSGSMARTALTAAWWAAMTAWVVSSSGWAAPRAEALVAGLGQTRHDGDHVGLVDGADVPDVLADDRGAVLDVAGEQVGRAVGGPAAEVLEPLWHGEVVQGDHGPQPAGEGAVDHAPVVRGLGVREGAGHRLDAGPLDAEPVVGEAEFREQVHVLLPAVVAVAGVQAGFRDVRRRVVFLPPPVAVDVVPLDLVGGGGRPHRKPSGKGREVRVIVLVSLVGVVRCRCDGRAGPVT